MKLWMSAEYEGDIDTELRESSNFVEEEINRVIESKSYPIELESLDCIMIIMQDDPNFDEVIKYSKKKRDMDFRLKIDYEKFVSASNEGRQKLIYEMLNRSLELLLSKGVSEKGIGMLRDDLTRLALNNNWVT